MKTKKEIIENLIREVHIGLDEALILLETEKETVYVPYQQPNYPVYPYPAYPLEPYYHNGFFVTCNSNSSTAGNSYVNTTVTQKTDVPFTLT
jgi:hypothetical protein